MKKSGSHSEAGFALLLFLVVLMGLGGIALSGFAQKTLKEVQSKKYEHNKRVLEEAKQALLMYAYLYSQQVDIKQGPGRLPCPDYDDDGDADGVANCNSKPGRFPWKDKNLNLYDIRDASNERLWYSVSDNFYNMGGPLKVINSETDGTLTIYDQSGSMVYDGLSSGVAAVIIAPGEQLDGQDRSDDPNEAANYLDRFDGFDNSEFDNGVNSKSAGFRLGPVVDDVKGSDTYNTIVINDQFILVTAEDVIHMAEKGVLEVYAQALADYETKAGEPYPWLYNYNYTTPDVGRYLDANRVTAPPNPAAAYYWGRIPSLFADYFTETNSQSIDSELKVSIQKSYEVINSIGPASGLQTVQLAEDSSTIPGLQFIDSDTDAVSNTVELVLAANGDILTAYKHYYRNVGGTTWSLCGNDAGDIKYCSRDSLGSLVTGGSNTNETESEILRVGINIDLTAASSIGLDLSGFDSTSDVSYEAPQATSDAYITASFAAGKLTSIPAQFKVELGSYATGTNPVFNPIESLPVSGQNFLDDVNLVLPSGDGVTNLSTGASQIGMRYYPELPSWAHSSRNNWHISILLAYSASYSPTGDDDCEIPADDCLVIEDQHLTDQKITALLVGAGRNLIVDDLNNGYGDDLSDLFDPKQTDADLVFSASNYDDGGDQGDDLIMILKTQ